MDRTQTTVGENGRIVIPAKMRQALDISAGDAVILSVVDKELRIVSLREAARRAQEIVRRFILKGVSLTEDLLDERRRELARERRRR